MLAVLPLKSYDIQGSVTNLEKKYTYRSIASLPVLYKTGLLDIEQVNDYRLSKQMIHSNSPTIFSWDILFSYFHVINYENNQKVSTLQYIYFTE